MTERERVILGALLHDIGKFYMRTGRPAEGYGRDEWRQEHGPSGAHARWSASFFSQYVPSQWREAGWLALTHHAPQRQEPLAELVQEADHLAAAFDRTKRPTTEFGDIARDRLQALAEQLALQHEGRALRVTDRTYAHALEPLNLRRETVFPRRTWPDAPLRAEYERLWTQFVDEVQRLAAAHEGRPDTFDVYVTTLLGLLERYTWCVPSATYRDYPNIPLFDHLKVTAAIAECLHATGAAKRFLFVEGDLGGIQAFLYESAAPSQTQEGTAQRLRGKSFFLDLAMRTLAERLRRDLDLSACAVLWCSGGHFALLAPDTPAAHAAIAHFRATSDRWCWEEFQGDVSVSVAAIAASEDDILKMPVLLERAARALGEAKQQRFATRLNDPSFWMLPLKNEVCHGCGRDVYKNEDFPPEAETDEGQKKCRRCRLFEVWGKTLPRTRALALVPVADADEEDLAFRTLDLAWRLVRDDAAEPAGTTLVLALGGIQNRDLRFLPLQPRPTVAYGVSAYSPTIPTEEGRPQTFDEMAAAAGGAPFLGVLRMDVDNLGAVFGMGVPERERSLSKLAALSRSMDWFFRGWVPVLAAEPEHGIYVTYSGGDDLFLVGPWDRLLRLSLRIEEDFRAFACENPDLTLSGGLALVKGKFPIGRAAERSGTLLNGVAKRRKGALADDCDKASLAIFNRKVPWPVMRRVHDLAETLLLPALADGRKLRRSILHHWLRLYAQYFGGSAHARSVSAGAQSAWLAKLLYGIARNVPDEGLAHRLRSELVSLPHWVPVLVGYTALRMRKGIGRERIG